ncbi:PD-(D/E)XK nuclease family protein [Nonlabens ponticola]|uniref:PD-(D/E)XK nuclease family protein n=1 Tax=Nonlabens ponticola TaxID=2496866 RepID=A0A3S9MW43_9FLAO|nr:PD-(D/E)XK nuclease family protein [Nonlabens ponticola]AZQ43362.1 PD-(D/E)XK nuclease family protein [Nonlabens ponticola]
MITFIDQVLDDLTAAGNNLLEQSYVVPSRRVGLMINRSIISRVDPPIFEPTTLSIQEFVEQLSQVQILPDLEILPYFYKAYLDVEPKEKQDSFEAFIGWAPTILKDFNEIDRYLVDPEGFFNYLGNYKALDTTSHWSLDATKTPMVTNYLDFWKKLHRYYRAMVDVCKQNDIAYQGLAYRLAFAKAKSSKTTLQNNYIFLGLNALNTAESQIVQQLLEDKQASIFWDADAYFIDRNYHEASKFMREFKSNWKFYESHPFEQIRQNYSGSKNLKVIGATGNLGMVQAASELISHYEPDELKKTAIILADEQLLLPFLQALPKNVSNYNVTMGLSLDKLPIATLFKDLFKLHRERTDQGFYFKNVVRVLESPFVNLLSPVESQKLLKVIREKNIIYVTNDAFDLKEDTAISLLLNTITQPQQIIERCFELIELLKKSIVGKTKDPLQLEQLLAMKEVIQELAVLTRDHENIENLKTLTYLLRQVLPLKNLDFIGEPIQGLQIMGVLETRALDYENIIMLSVNEGTLPAGKSQSSYIPYEMKRQFGMPTYSDKDSIYAYHFYRLLHRCNSATFIYNQESDTLGGGEKSRFLLQLEVDKPDAHILKSINYYSKVNPVTTSLIEVPKTEAYLKRLKQIAANGFSPSALTSYVRNPVDFFAQKIMRISQMDDVEEDIAFNTMGNIIHEALDKLYQPVQGKILIDEDFKAIRQRIKHELDKAYKECYDTSGTPLGKNKLIYEVSHHYIKMMVAADADLVKQGKELIIKSVEQQLETVIDIPEIGQVKLHGKVDRIDTVDGELRIIDYKSGNATKTQVSVDPADYEALITDYERAKAFQVLMYAYLYSKKEVFDTATGGIISFKKFSDGLISFTEKQGRTVIKSSIDHEVLDRFEQQLIALIKELFDMNQPLTEKEV